MGLLSPELKRALPKIVRSGVTSRNSNEPAGLMDQFEPTEVDASRLAAAHERAGRLLSDRYAEQSIGQADFEKLMAQLRNATDVVAVDSVVDALHHIPRAVVPASAEGEARSVALPDDERRVFAFMSEQKRKGSWSVPRVLKVLAVMSDVKLDFRHTDIPHGFTMDVQCIMAQVTIIVPPDMAADFNVFTVMGSTDSAAPNVRDAPFGARTMSVSGGAVMGEVKVVVRAR